MPKITPFLWFDGQAEEAANFYCGIFKNSRVESVIPGPGGKSFGVTFALDGQRFMAIDGGPMFKFTEAISMYVSCEDQAEVDYFWEKLLDGGEASRCGWLKDKFGLSWQIIPKALGECLGGDDEAGAERAKAAMMGMVKLDVAGLRAAYEGR